MKIKELNSETNVYKVNELSKILNIHQNTIYKYIKEGKIKGRKIGKCYFITEKSIKDLIYFE